MATISHLHPTQQNSEQVRVLAACGASEEFIAHEIGVTLETLRTHYRADIDLGPEDANARVALTFFQMASSGQHPNLTVSWLKMKAGWKEAPTLDVVDPPDLETARQKLKDLVKRSGGGGVS